MKQCLYGTTTTAPVGIVTKSPQELNQMSAEEKTKYQAALAEEEAKQKAAEAAELITRSGQQLEDY